MTEPAPPSPPPSPWDGDTASSPPPAVEPVAARTGWKQWAAAGAVAAVLAIGAGVGISLTGGDDADAVATQDSAAVAAAGDAGTQAGLPGGRGTAGTITAIDGSTLTLEATAQDSGDTSTVTVETTDETTVTESVEGSLADLDKGDNVLIMGTSADGTVTAQRIVDSGDVEATGPGAGGRTGTPPEGMGTPPDGMGTPPEGMGTPTVGAIASIEGSTFVVETSDGESVTVTATDDTTVTITKQLTMEDLATGDTITVTGTTSDATVSATSIRKGELGVGGGFGGPGGGPGMAPPEGFTPPDGSGSSTPTTTA